MKKNKLYSAAGVSIMVILTIAICIGTVKIKNDKANALIVENNTIELSVDNNTSTNSVENTSNIVLEITTDVATETTNNAIKTESTTIVPITKKTTTTYATTSTTTTRSYKTIDTSVQVTDFEMKVFEFINVEREKEGLTPLKWDDTIHALAHIRANEECHKGYDHVRPDGSDALTVFEEYGINRRYRGENLIGGVNLTIDDAQILVNMFMNSQSHKEIILSSNANRSAVSIEYNADGRMVLVQLFSS